MERITVVRDHPAVLKRYAFTALLPIALVMVAALGIAYLADVPVSDLLRDPAATLDGAWYVGIFSTTGIALWAVAAALCLLLLVSDPPAEARALLIAGVVVSLLLGADDGFLLHETIKNDIGIPSPVTIGVYGVVALFLFRRAWPYLVNRHNLAVFVVAVALFAVSVILDAGGEAGLPTPPGSAIIEDVAKFLGIATWAVFFGGVCRRLILDRSKTPVRPS